MPSLPKFKSLEAHRTPQTAPNRKLKENLEEDFQNIDLTPQRPVKRRNKTRHAMIRPVTWTGNDSITVSDPEDEINEAEQLVRRRQLKAQTVQRQLDEEAVRQIELEQQSLQIEKTIRGGTKGDSMELMEEWFRLVEEKNQLLRKENELMIEQRELQLQDHQQSIAATIRERLKLPESAKSERDRREDKLLARVTKKYTGAKLPKPTLYIKHIERSIV